jgi:hypothetical protein
MAVRWPIVEEGREGSGSTAKGGKREVCVGVCCVGGRTCESDMPGVPGRAGCRYFHEQPLLLSEEEKARRQAAYANLMLQWTSLTTFQIAHNYRLRDHMNG